MPQSKYTAIFKREEITLKEMSGKCLILYTWVHDFGIETNLFNPEDYTNCLYFIPASTTKFLLFVLI